MTDYKAVPDWDVDSWPVSVDPPDDAVDELWDPEAELWDPDSESEWDWDSIPVQPSPPPSPPWFRSPRLLLALIGLAAAMLVVATALLVGGRFGGQIPTSPQLNIRTGAPSPSSTANPAPREPSRTTTPPSTSASPTTSAPVETPPDQPVAPEPAESAPPPPPAEQPAAEAPKRSNGPRINVTRTPMSFTPSVSARP